jgi:acyl-CoA thioesterase
MLNAEQQKIAHEIFKKVPYINLLGMELIDIKSGEATLELKMRDELRQPYGLLHGGATASLIDTATAFALVSVLEKEDKTATVDLTVHYLRPVMEGSITCLAKVVKVGRRLSTVSAEVLNDENKLVATALSTYTKI